MGFCQLNRYPTCPALKLSMLMECCKIALKIVHREHIKKGFVVIMNNGSWIIAVTLMFTAICHMYK